ncbi:ImmA/IrrE family metallo-endopeptidase [Clostridium paraputrificum]|uniref:ImmA/IrrE family metallo-endopeptidase n=1 Tax=Clostridium paraputrificum TaxID=29363 RepID=UPI00232AA4C5|nr:ImmA/IrrE family metallo-endopeptidase [Clostridium paraputrificum]MDB2105430.1 ImmA/IrrE family metallo-endopeptidase [Clostridium paraputrificum]MDB2112484.1 ImmA/IrrE family metallo-endopeptidase [Clostridium paraputrificum]
MRKRLELLDLIEKENINLDEELKIPKTSGIYINIPGINPTIGINKSVSNDKEYYSILAEELGHHFKTIGNLIKQKTTYIEDILKQKEELKAKLWASNFFISDEEFIQAILDCSNNIYTLAERFNVTEEIINYKILSICIDEIRLNKVKEIIRRHEVQYLECNI